MIRWIALDPLNKLSLTSFLSLHKTKSSNTQQHLVVKGGGELVDLKSYILKKFDFLIDLNRYILPKSNFLIDLGIIRKSLLYRVDVDEHQDFKAKSKTEKRRDASR